jgi:hypothetical protein
MVFNSPLVLVVVPILSVIAMLPVLLHRLRLITAFAFLMIVIFTCGFIAILLRQVLGWN